MTAPCPLRLAAATLLLASAAGCAQLRDMHTPIHSPVRVASDASPPRRVAANSTYGAAATLFADRIARRVGDVLTVSVRIDDRASLSNTSNRSRSVGRTLSADGAGKIAHLVKALRGQASVASGTTFDGEGGTDRSESIRLLVAAVVREVLPGGNLLVEGRQEVRVNAEMRVLEVRGIARPVDLGTANVVSYERLAEARISYGGRGPVAEMQRPPWGQRLFDKVSPF